MIFINEQDFFKKFKCEPLTAIPKNQELIQSFVANKNGKLLESYLKNKAWKDDLEGETKVYLVKDENGQIALFFSIKCGLLYDQYGYDKLDESQLEFVNWVIEAKVKDDQRALDGYYACGEFEFNDVDKLFRIADEKIELKMEGKELGDTVNTLKVSSCYSAIEIQHFCKNSLYKLEENIKVSLGFGLFWEVIVPHILKVTNSVGCKYLYLFAAEQQKEQGKPQKLLQYYKTALKFSDVEGINIIKPSYDKYCYGMIQSIADLRENKETIWKGFSDFV